MKNRLKGLRTERGWSQAVLGARLDVSRQTINAIEAGRYDPSLPLAFKIARLFEMTIEDVFECEVETDSEAHAGIDKGPRKIMRP